MCQLRKGQNWDSKHSTNWKLKLETGCVWLVLFACLLCSLGVSQDKSVLAIYQQSAVGNAAATSEALLEGDCHEQKQISSLMEDQEGDGVPLISRYVSITWLKPLID